MKKASYKERDYAFGQLMLRLRTTINMTQAGLAEQIGVSRHAVGEWEAGLSYPKAERLKGLILLGVRASAFAVGHEEEEIRTLWKAARQKVQLDEAWLHDLLASPEPIGRFPPAKTSALHSGEDFAAFPRIDWIGALDVSHFAGREVEVAELTQWIVQEHCRMVVLLGIGGIGKSLLASFLGQRLAPRFEAVLWRSVRDAPLCEDVVANCITFFSETPPTEFPPSLELRINQLLACLQTRRCLLVLDNLETLLESGDRAGNYLPGYEGYGRLLQRLAESAHQSCVLLTSREKPKEIQPLEGVRGLVRSFRLTGVDEQIAQALLLDKGLRGTPVGWQQLVASYAGNPLALKIVAQVISDLFDGDIDRFLREGTVIFNGIRPVLRQQVERLTSLEHLLLTWLAVLREWTPLEALQQVLSPRVPRTQILEALEALERRSLLERGLQANFSLQSVVMEYLTNVLVERLSEEILQGEPQQIRRYALEQGQAKDYIRQTQVRLLVHPLLDQLRSELGADAQIETHLLRLLSQFRTEDTTQDYGPANVISLLKSLRGHLRDLDLSRLSIVGAYLQNVEMQDTTLAESMLHEVAFTEAFDAVLSVAVSPDGHYVAAGSNSGQVRVWREEGRVAHLTIRGHTDRVGAIVFSLDGQTLATGSWDSTIKIWDMDSGAMLWTLRDTRVPITSLALGPNETLISGSYDGVMHFWNLRTGTHLSHLQTQGGPIFTIACSPDGHLLASGSLDSVIRLWDTEQGTLLRELHGHRNAIFALAFAPATSLLASGSLDQLIKLWEVETGVSRTTLEGHTGAVTSLVWTPDGRMLASASYDMIIRLWDSQSWQCRHVLHEHRDAITSLAFLPLGDRLLSGSFDQTVRTWEVTSGRNVRTMNGHALVMFALSWSPDGRFLLSGSSEGTLTLWNATSLTPMRVLYGHKQRVNTVAWSRDGNRLASGSHDQTVRIWDAQTGTCTHILQGHTGTVFSVDWSFDSRLLASGGYDGTVRIWNMQEGTSRVEGEHTGPVNAVMWSPDGTLVASASEDGQVLIWRATDGDLLHRFEHARGVITALSWSANGEQLVSGAAEGEKGVLSIWDVRQGTLIRTLEGHSGSIWGIDWSPEQDILVSTGADGTVRWWDPQQGVNLATVPAHDAWARAVRVSPDGKTIASCGEDGVIKLWDMQSHQHLATLRADRPYERLNISGTGGLTHAQQLALRALGASSMENDQSVVF